MKFKLLAFLLLVAIVPARANEQVVISIALPEQKANSFPAEVLQPFESQHPGVKVNVVKIDAKTFYYPPAADDLTKYVEGISQYASSADVLYVNDERLAVEDTRGGYLLDLAPLVNADQSLQTDDFLPNAWQSFQWDNGVWAIPVTADVTALSYDQAAFDKLGLAYPGPTWTVDDLVNAVQKLTIRDSSGKVEIPGLYGDAFPLLRSLLNAGFYDASSLPDQPRLATPQLAGLLEAWSKLDSQGLTGTGFSGDLSAIPLFVGHVQEFQRLLAARADSRQISALPGGSTFMSVEGFAVSAGTQQPDLAYQLAVYLSNQPNILGVDTISARKSLNDQQASWTNLPTATQALFTQAQPASELRYGDYVRKALEDINANTLDAATALNQAQDHAQAALQTLAQQKSSLALQLATPMPVMTDDTALRFDLVPGITPLPNAKEWQQAVDDFTSADPEVKSISLSTDFINSSDDQAKYDCFYPSFPLFIDTSQVLDLTPLTVADPDFDKSDFIGDVLSQQDNKIWGYPLDLQPETLRYNAAMFSKAGLQPPDNKWTINQFVDALKTLKTNLDGTPPFVPHQDRQADKYLLMLIAAYGGTPIDYRVNPPVVNLTSPETSDAIRETLDLAKQGYIKYSRLHAAVTTSAGFQRDAVYNTIVNTLWYNNDTMAGQQKPDPLVNYPRGKLTSISLGVGMGYVSARSTQPEACYRWLSFISKRPELLWGMPARRSVLASQRMSVINPDEVTYDKQIEDLTKTPNAFFIPFDLGYADNVYRYWLDDAFDAYVLDNADLADALQKAQAFADTYKGCIDKLPPLIGLTQDVLAQEYQNGYIGCAVKIDPRPATKAWLGWKG